MPRSLNRRETSTWNKRGKWSGVVVAPTVAAKKVMPLGDSLVQVYGGELGFKGKLFNSLAAENYAVDYVGSQTSEAMAGLIDRNHQGHSGWYIENFRLGRDGVPTAGALVATYQPDVVLMYMGTNELWNSIAPSTAITRLRAVIDQIYASMPTCHIVLCKLALLSPSTPTGIGTARATFNSSIDQVLTDYVAANRKMTVADLSNTLSSGDLQTDGIHWHPSGHTKVAAALLPIMKTVFDGTVAPPPPPPVSGSRSTAKPNAPAAIANLTWNTTFLDDFEGTSLDRTKWTEYQSHQKGTVDRDGGYSFDAFYPVPGTVDKYGPGTKTIEVGTFNGASALKLKARRQAGVPSSDKWTTAQLFTHPGSHWSGGWLSPTTAGTKAEFYEARVWCQGGFGTSEQWWGLGTGQWPIGGEWDFMEMFNLDEGWLGIPHLSLHWPKDIYTNPPGSWLNDYHIGKGYRDPAGQLTMLNRWITIGTYRDANVIRGYVNGNQFVEYVRGQSFNGSDPVPDLMFNARMGLILGLGVGGYQGSAKPESEWQPADYFIDYAQAWVQA